MYARAIIDDKLSEFRKKYGWLPEEHSVEEIDLFNKKLESRYVRDKHGDQVFDDSQLTPGIAHWMKNERALVALDCSYFLTRYFWLTENEIQRFAFRSGQKAFYNVVQRLEEKGVSQEIQALKARKQGISTVVEAMMTHSALYVPGARCSIGSADDQKTAVMMDMMYGALEHIPWYIRPTQTKDKRSGRALLQFARIGTSIVVQHGAMRGGIGQGTTPNKIHLSECCDYTNPVAQIEEGLFKAVPSMPYVLMVLESTGNGNTGWWADQWRLNKEKYWLGRSRLLPLFLPWFMTPELYPTDHWLSKFPFPEGWHRDECPEAMAMADKARAFVMSSPMLLEILGRDWILPDRQLWYWQYHYEEAKVRRMEKSWTRQMATDDYDALIGDNDSSFDRDSILQIDSGRQKTCQIYGILGEGIEEKHDPDPMEVDYTEPRVPVEWTTVNDIKLNWMLMPLRGDVEDKNFDPLKKLLVWCPPERGAKYSIGVDTGFGVGGDRSAIEVNRCGEGIVPDEQVAEFAADDITNVELYAWAMCIAAWYGKYMEDGETPRFVIEQRRKYGDSCYHALKLHGFRRHHHFRHYDKKTMRPIQSPNQQEGWWTNEWSRPMLLETYKHATGGNWCKINSRFLLAEMEKSEQIIGSSGKIREDHVTGEHDDRKFAMAMAYFTWHDSDLMAERSKQRYNSPENEDVEIDYGQAVMSVPNPGAEEFFAQYR
jgi:hypothetical protein